MSRSKTYSVSMAWKDIAVVFGCGLVAIDARNEHLNEREQEFKIRRCGFKAKRD